MGSKEIGINTRNWVGSTQNRDNWRALVNAALNLLFPQTMELVIHFTATPLSRILHKSSYYHDSQTTQRSTIPSELRPICLLHHAGKVLERIILKRLHTHNPRHKFAIREEHSTTLQLLRFNGDTTGFLNHEQITAVFSDIQKLSTLYDIWDSSRNSSTEECQTPT